MSKVALTEDITPVRICLLLLISLYAENRIPDAFCRPLMSVVVRILENETITNENGELLFFPGPLDLLKQIDAELGALHDGLHSKDLKRLFLLELWNICSVDDLDKKINRAELFLVAKDTILIETGLSVATKPISPRSFLGGVIQKMVATYKLLQFDEMLLFFESFVDFRSPSRELYLDLGGTITEDKTKEKDAELYLNIADRLHETLGLTAHTAQLDKTNLVSLSKSTTRALLEKQVTLLETYGGSIPDSVSNVLEAMALQEPGLTLALNLTFSQTPAYYYSRYLQDLHESNYHGALDSLHQYFDYMVSNNSKYFYHFALISRASLHQYFGEFEQALDAIEEAISVARENKDNSTLTFILSWLYNLMSCKPDLWRKQSFYHNNNALNLLDFLITKSQSVSILLHCISYLYETVHTMDSAGTMARYLETLVKAMFLSLHDSKASHIRAAEMAGTVWSRIGQLEVSEMYASMSSENAVRSGRLFDQVALKIRQSFLLLPNEDGSELYSELCTLLQQICKKDQALENLLKIRCAMLLIEIHLRRGRLFLAKALTDDLLLSDMHDNDIHIELVYLKAKVEVALNNHAAAFATISTFLSSLDSESYQSTVSLHSILRIKLLQCAIYSETGNPLRAFSLLMSQLIKARDVGYSGIVCEGLVVLSSVQAKLGKHEEAYQILESNMPRVLSMNNIELTSSAFFELASGCYRIAQNAKSSPEQDKDLFSRFLRYLNAAINGYKRMKHLRKLLACFSLEKNMAIVKQNSDLIEHSQQAIAKLHAQLREEAAESMV